MTLLESSTKTTTQALPTIYTETMGTTCLLYGQRGTVVGLHREGPHVSLAFVRLDPPVDESGRFTGQGSMLAATLGRRTGDRLQLHEVTGWRVIDRDEFDRITGLDMLRADLGWRLS